MDKLRQLWKRLDFNGNNIAPGRMMHLSFRDAVRKFVQELVAETTFV